MIIPGYKFKNKKLLEQALTHPSKGAFNNQRLEFLGDAVLNCIVADLLYMSTDESEGKMTVDRQSMVSKAALAKCAEKLKIKDYIICADNTAMSDKVLSSCVEAIIGAIYLDGGIEEAKKFCSANITQADLTDYKGKLQHISPNGEYKLVSKTGPDDKAHYKIGYYKDGLLISEGEGSSKKNAEKEAAKIALNILEQGKEH